MRPFYLGKNKHGYYRAYFVDAVTGQITSAKSTHSKDKIEAAVIATSMLNNGVPTFRSNSRAFAFSASNNFVNPNPSSAAPVSIPLPVSEPVLSSKTIPENKPLLAEPVKTDGIKLCEFLWNFWDFDTSEFIKRRLAHGHSITKKHTICMQAYIKNNFLPYFGKDMCIEDLDRHKLDDFFFYLRDEKHFSAGTVNKNMNCANVGFKWLLDNGKIKTNPLTGIEKFKIENEKRGIPTESEVKALLELDWNNNLAKLAFKLAAFFGLRAGEISGLRVCDIDVAGDMLHVRHSWSEVDKLKSTKNSDTRDLPIDHMTALQLMNQARLNPEYNDMSYVFYAPHNPKEPFYPGYYGDIFYLALEKIGVSPAERKDRNIVFHSLRHFCCTVLSQRTDIKTVQSIMGHRTEKMSEHYADHENQEKLDNMRVIMSEAWEKYLSA